MDVKLRDKIWICRSSKNERKLRTIDDAMVAIATESTIEVRISKKYKSVIIHWESNMDIFAIDEL